MNYHIYQHFFMHHTIFRCVISRIAVKLLAKLVDKPLGKMASDKQDLAIKKKMAHSRLKCGIRLNLFSCHQSFLMG
jgi:hypothetical protein